MCGTARSSSRTWCVPSPHRALLPSPCARPSAFSVCNDHNPHRKQRNQAQDGEKTSPRQRHRAGEDFEAASFSCGPPSHCRFTFSITDHANTRRNACRTAPPPMARRSVTSRLYTKTRNGEHFLVLRVSIDVGRARSTVHFGGGLLRSRGGSSRIIPVEAFGSP